MQTAHNFDELYEQVKVRKVPFFLVFFVVIFLTYAFLYIIDFYPEPKTTDTEAVSEAVAVDESEVVESVTDTLDPVTETEETVFTVTEPVAEVVEESEMSPAEALPVKIIFDDLGTESVVLNPESRTIEDLDAALLEGVVRHPDSADFSEPGNIFILGHSSYLPNVFNKNFQAFNGVQNLEWGDTIRLQSEGKEYVYRVDRVYQAKASEVVVPVDGDKAQLTLATCNSFGSQDDRYIVESTLVSERVL